MKLRLLTGADLEALLPMPVAVQAMRTAFLELARGEAEVPQRMALSVPEQMGVALVKPALTADGLGAKLVSVFPDNRSQGLEVTTGIVVLLDRATGHPLGLCDGTVLTALRTGATSALATDLLARREVRAAALIGCGGQARTQALAVEAVRDLATLTVFAPTRTSMERFAEEMQPRLRARIELATTADEAIAGAELVCTATTSSTPVFDGRRLRAGTHVNAIGSFTSEMRELDRETVRRARVYVDSRAAALAEAGELLHARRAGATRVEHWTEIGEVLAGERPGRRDDQEVTLFKSVGLAVQDIKAATVALRRAAEQGIGMVVEL